MSYYDEEHRQRERELLRDPRYVDARRAARRLELAPKLAEYQRLGLSLRAEQADRLLDFWVDRDLDELGKRRAASPRTHAESLAFAENQAKLEDERNATLRAALGDVGYEAYNDFMASRHIRNLVVSFDAQLADGGNTLRADQFEPLVRVLHAEDQRLTQQQREYLESDSFERDRSDEGMQRSQERMALMTAAAHQRMHDSSASILSSRQLAALDAMLKRERDIQRARHDIDRIEMQADRAGN